jgi:Cu/Ag efflux protein CusF
MRINRYVIFTVMLFVALALCVTTATADQHSGTWKMDPAKSKYSPGPAAKSLTLKVESDAKGVKIDSEGIDGEGNPTHVQYDAKLDGKDYPVTGLPYGDMVVVKRIDANTIQTTIKKGDKVAMTVTSKVSADGKTRTSTFIGKDAQGRAVHNVVVYDKQ